MVHGMWMRPGGLGIEISPSHESKYNQIMVSPHHGGALIAEGVGLERRDAWVESTHAPVNVGMVAEHVTEWLRSGASRLRIDGENTTAPPQLTVTSRANGAG